MPDASQCAASGGPYSTNAPNSPQPAGPSISATSRVVMPRKPHPHRQRHHVQARPAVRPARASLLVNLAARQIRRAHLEVGDLLGRPPCADRPTAPPGPRTCRPPASRSRRRRTAAKRRRWSGRGSPARRSTAPRAPAPGRSGAMRVTATLMLRSGSSGVTGGSLCNEMRIPVATADPAGIQRDPRSGPNSPSTMTSPQ